MAKKVLYVDFHWGKSSQKCNNLRKNLRKILQKVLFLGGSAWPNPIKLFFA
jgi:hypothetical protein